MRENDLTILTAGKFDTYAEAQKHRDMLQQKGLGDSFVTAFNKRKRIPVRVALKFLDQEETKEELVPQKRGKK